MNIIEYAKKAKEEAEVENERLKQLKSRDDCESEFEDAKIATDTFNIYRWILENAMESMMKDTIDYYAKNHKEVDVEHDKIDLDFKIKFVDGIDEAWYDSQTTQYKTEKTIYFQLKDNNNDILWNSVLAFFNKVLNAYKIGKAYTPYKEESYHSAPIDQYDPYEYGAVKVKISAPLQEIYNYYMMELQWIENNKTNMEELQQDYNIKGRKI